MKSLKLNKTFYLVLVIIALIIYIISIKKEQKEIIIPSVENTKIIENPVPVVKYDTIYKDRLKKIEVEKIVKVKNPINKELYSKYEQALKENDSLKQITLYKEAITERNYKEIFEDSIQVITVKSEVTGFLNKQTINYKTKERTIVISERNKPSFYVGAFAYDFTNNPSFGANLNLLNKKKTKIFTVGYDTKNRVHAGITLKLF